MMLVAGLGAVISLFVRFRRARGEERQQIKWFAFAAAADARLVARVVVPTAPSPGQPSPCRFSCSGALDPRATGIAILRYRLYDIDLIINRTLVYGSLTATLALSTSAVSSATAEALRHAHRPESTTLAVVASTLVIAALFNPLRRRIQSFIDRRFYRRKYDARKTLEAFSAKLRDETDLEALNNDLVGVVRETMQPAHVSLWLRPETAPKGEQAE